MVSICSSRAHTWRIRQRLLLRLQLTCIGVACLALPLRVRMGQA